MMMMTMTVIILEYPNNIDSSIRYLGLIKNIRIEISAQRHCTHSHVQAVPVVFNLGYAKKTS
jgi:hypothetical protein